MGWRIVRQPNGLLARFSEICDNFTHSDMTVAEAVRLCVDRHDMGPKAAARKVDAGVRDELLWTPGEPPRGDGLDRWRDALATIRAVHGEAEARKMERKIAGATGGRP